MNVRVLVVRAPGTNCDQETLHAFSLAGATGAVVHLNHLLDNPSQLANYQILCIPGGFSFGDDIASGVIFASALRERLGDTLRGFRDRGGLILGICNGFQVLMRTGMFDEDAAPADRPAATLTLNRQARYEDRWVQIRLQAGRCAFVPHDDLLTLPVAHAEGRFLARRPELLAQWQRDARIVASYSHQGGPAAGQFPANPNGSEADVAGICDATGRVFALMPHPERYVCPTQHPSWTRQSPLPAEGDGLRLFRHAVGHFA